MACDCAKKCVPGKCVCVDSGLPCTDACKLNECDNMLVQDGDDDIMSADDDDDSDDDQDSD